MTDNTVQNLYPEQLTEVISLISALNAFTKDNEKHINIGSEIKVFDEDALVLLGFVVDEIGGAWSFRAATSQECREHNMKLSVLSDSFRNVKL